MITYRLSWIRLCLMLVAIVVGTNSRRCFAADKQSALASRLLAEDNPVADGSVVGADESEAAALLLVRDELPQLSRVLDRLRSDSPSHYEKAIRDISRSAKRLESMRLRDEKLYSLELDLLKSRTSISLLVARLKVRDNESDRDSLRRTIGQLHSAELSRAKYEVESIEKRLQRTEEQLSDAQTRLSKRSSDLDRRLDSVYTDYLRKAGRSADGSAIKKRSRDQGESE